MIQTQQNQASPNATVYVSSLTATGSATNIDAAFVPKGSGAVLAAVPNSATSGGNKRGTNAVDLQTGRNAATQVASGNYSAIGGGKRNTASGLYSVVCCGYSNTSNGDYAFSAGRLNTASGAYSAVLNGRSNTASGSRSIVGGGMYNTASGNYSSILGGRDSTTRSLYGMSAIASGKFGTQGDAQRGQYVLRGLTTDATVKTLTANQQAAATNNQVILPNNSSYIVRGLINSHRTDSIGTSSSWSFTGCIRRGANAAATVVVASITPAVIAQDAGAIAWAVAVTADTTNGCLKVTFTGMIGSTVRSVVLIETLEVTS